jgi:hypothetical protein
MQWLPMHCHIQGINLDSCDFAITPYAPHPNEYVRNAVCNALTASAPNPSPSHLDFRLCRRERQS